MMRLRGSGQPQLRDSISQKSRQPTGKLAGITRFAFPYDQTRPPQVRKLLQHRKIALDILPELFLPEILPGFWHGRFRATWVAMPEAAMNENCLLTGAEHNIWLARQLWRVQSISVAHRVQYSSDYQFRLCILCPDARHV